MIDLNDLASGSDFGSYHCQVDLVTRSIFLIAANFVGSDKISLRTVDFLRSQESEAGTLRYRKWK